MLVELLCGVALLFLLYKWYRLPPRLTLPGPYGLPVLGNLFSLTTETPHILLSKWSEKYGAVYTMRLTSENWVVVNDYDYIHQVLVKDGVEFAGRPRNLFRFNYWTRGRQDIFFQQPGDHYWNTGRKVLHRSIKQYSSGMQHIEEIINRMTSQFIKKQMSFQGQPYDPTDDIYNYTLSNLLHLTLGKDIDENSELFSLAKKLERTTIESHSMTGRGTELDMFPWLRFFGNWAYKNLTLALELQSTIWEKVKPDLLDQLDDENPGCIMEALILAQQSKAGAASISETNVLLSLADILVAGTTTSSHTIMSLLLILLHYPEVMSNLQKEVDDTVGHHRLVGLSDREKMPYTRAVVYEVLRYSSIVPLGVSHAAMGNMWISGSRVPKGTIIITNLWQLHHDEMFWDEPWEFMPERFLNEEGELVPADHPNRKHLMPFGAGTRVCVGEIFALTRLFMFTATLMQKFDVLPVSDSELPPCDPKTYTLGSALCPVVGKIRMCPR